MISENAPRLLAIQMFARLIYRAKTSQSRATSAKKTGREHLDGEEPWRFSDAPKAV